MSRARGGTVALFALMGLGACQPAPSAEEDFLVTRSVGFYVEPEASDEAPGEATDTVDLVERRDIDLDDGTWGYQRRMHVDLDDDGTDEEVLLAAQAEAIPGGEVAWDDGQVWVIRIGPAGGKKVAEPAGTPQWAYARFVQLGRVDVSVLDEEPKALLVEERTPHALRAFRVGYDATDGVTVTRQKEWFLDPSVGWR
jgi:hypothetical protein